MSTASPTIARWATRLSARPLLGLLGLLSLLGLLNTGACKATPPTNFYVLTSRADEDVQAGSREETGTLLGIGPIELPDYLDQPQIVTRSSPNALRLAEFDQWAEPLGQGITRVLAENLAQQLVTERIALFPWKRADAVDMQVAVRITRFESVSDQALLTAEWRLVSPAGVDVLTRRSSFVEALPDSDYASKVAALSRTLSGLSDEIAQALASATSD